MGTATVSDVVEAELTTALVAPKNTISLAAVALNPVPVMVTVVPGLPVLGLTVLMTGWDKHFRELKIITINIIILFIMF